MHWWDLLMCILWYPFRLLKILWHNRFIYFLSVSFRGEESIDQAQLFCELFCVVSFNLHKIQTFWTKSVIINPSIDDKPVLILYICFGISKHACCEKIYIGCSIHTERDININRIYINCFSHRSFTVIPWKDFEFTQTKVHRLSSAKSRLYHGNTPALWLSCTMPGLISMTTISKSSLQRAASETI